MKIFNNQVKQYARKGYSIQNKIIFGIFLNKIDEYTL